MSSRALLAMINQTVIGTLYEVDGLWGFQYAPEWVNSPDGFAISPSLPRVQAPLLDGASKRPVQWYFDNLLPEEAQRTLMARDAQLDSADAFGLLRWYGAESAGSLTLLPPDAPAPVGQPVVPLPDKALHARICQLPHTPLTHGAVKRMSLAGAQHKLAVVLQDGAVSEPAGATPSTHILKPDHPDPDYPHSVINEWFVMRLAQGLKLDVPNVHRRYVPAPVYLVDRFDRIRSAGGRRVTASWQRRHSIDACQALGLDRSFKYSQGSIDNLSALANACRSPAIARTRLFSWLVFNVLVGNSDAHLKNLSFLVAKDGIQLAPFYDLLSIAAYDTPAFQKSLWPQRTQLAWPILGQRHFSDIHRDVLLDAGSALGLTRGTAQRLLETLRGRIMQEAESQLAKVMTDNAKLVAQRPELAATLAGEARCLRTIVYIVIKEMSANLA